MQRTDVYCEMTTTGCSVNNHPLSLSHTHTGKSVVIHAVVVHGMVSSTPTPGLSLEGRHATGTGPCIGQGPGGPSAGGGAAVTAVRLLHLRTDLASRLPPPALIRPHL